MYIIVNGGAEVVRIENGIERSLARLGPGEYFGEMALLRQSTRGATVRCTAPMDALSLPKREFSMLAAYLPQVREPLEAVTEKRARANAQASAAVDTNSVAARIKQMEELFFCSPPFVTIL